MKTVFALMIVLCAVLAPTTAKADDYYIAGWIETNGNDEFDGEDVLLRWAIYEVNGVIHMSTGEVWITLDFTLGETYTIYLVGTCNAPHTIVYNDPLYNNAFMQWFEDEEGCEPYNPLPDPDDVQWHKVYLPIVLER